MIFALHIFLSTIAAGGAYAILMSVLKKEVSTAWLKWESIFTTLATLGAIVVSWNAFMMSNAMLEKIPTVLLLGGTIIGIHLSHKCVKLKAPIVPSAVAERARVGGIVLASILCLHWLLIVYLIAF